MGRAKSIPWDNIKLEYFNGVTPKDLALKYDLTPKQISDKVNKSKWKVEKDEVNTQIAENLRATRENRIQGLVEKALEVLDDVLEDPEVEARVKVQACNTIADISGLKSSKMEVESKAVSININHEAVEVERD